MYRLVIFDFDGTLGDSGDCMLAVMNRIAGKHRFRQVDHAEIDTLRGMKTREIMKSLGVRMWRLPFIAADMRRRGLEDAGAIALFPGIEGLLQGLHAAGVKIAIVSSNSEALIRRVLGPLAGLVSWYDCGTGLFGKARKFRALVRRAGCAKREVFCVGDEERDIEAAHKAGIEIAAVSWGYAAAQVLEAARPGYMFDSVEALRGFLMGREAVEAG